MGPPGTSWDYGSRLLLQSDEKIRREDREGGTEESTFLLQAKDLDDANFVKIPRSLDEVIWYPIRGGIH